MLSGKDPQKAGASGLKGQAKVSGTGFGDRKPAKLAPCNPSVCVGNAQPTSCYCPTKK